MKRAWIDQLAPPGGGRPLLLDSTRAAGDECVEGFLVDPDTGQAWLLIAGVAIVPPALDAYLDAHADVATRLPTNDPRLGRRVLRIGGSGHDHVPFAEIVQRYGDLLPPALRARVEAGHVEDQSLAGFLAGDRPRWPFDAACVVLGAGVGRSCFVVRPWVGSVVGVEWSLARVRRARNLACTERPFLLPVARTSRDAVDEPGEAAIDLAALVREGVDFVAGAAEALPFVDACADVVVVPLGDSRGPWADATRVWAEARRILRPGGVLVGGQGESGALRWQAIVA